ncbi:type II secretion system protein [Pontibacillus halophilus]|nr:type II secretion system protein [Pontibacillus halophilus]
MKWKMSDEHMKLKEQSGYTMLVVLLVFTIISILGLALIGLTVNSTTSVSVTETKVTSINSAESELDETLAVVQNELDRINEKIDKNKIIDIDGAKLGLLNLIQELIRDNPDYEITYDFDLLSEGMLAANVTMKIPVDNSDKVLVKEIEFSTIADIFKYSTVTPGNLTLNGASYIEGDVYVGEDLYTSKSGKFISGSTFYPETTYPAFTRGELTVGGDFKELEYVKRRSCWFFSCYYYYDDVTSTFNPTDENLEKYFSLPPKVENQQEIDTSLKVLEDFIEPAEETIESLRFISSSYNRFTHIVKNNLNGFENNTTYGTTLVDKGLTIASGRTTVIHGDLVVNNRFSLKNASKLVVHGDLIVESDMELTKGAELEVTGDLKVTGNLESEDKDNSLIVNGSMLVSGNLSVSGYFEVQSDDGIIFVYGDALLSNVSFTGEMYSNDDVDLREEVSGNSTIYAKDDITVKQLSSGELNGTLVLLANGDMQLSNNNLYEDASKVMRVFLYSNNKLEIYGVGSNIEISGGIYGSDIILNAVKGKTYEGIKSYKTGFDAYEGNNYTYIERNQESITPKLSRLKVIYNKDMILNPPKGIPTVENISFKEVDRYYE